MQRRYAEMSGSNHGIALVAELEGEVCGMVGVDTYRVWHRDAPVGHIGTLVVAERVRGKGAGSALLSVAEQWLRDHGAHHVILTCALHRSEAHHFYLQRGYQLSGQRFGKNL